ncbi:MAG: hypothetical protein AAF730_12785 [Bacteroidota bacterium]
MRPRFYASVILALLLAAPVFAQAPTYTRTPGDVLRYRIATDSESTTFTPSAAFDRMFERDLDLAFTFEEADSVEAIVEGFDLESGNPVEPESYDLADAIEGAFRFALRADSMGSVVQRPELKRDPVIGSSIAGELKLFFPPLPQEPLVEGTTWTWSRSVAHDKGGTHSEAYTYTVVDETTMNGYTVTVIEMTGETTTQGLFESSTGSEVDLDNKDTHNTTYYFAVDEGLLVGFDRTTETKAYSEIEAMGRTMTSDRESQTTTKARLRSR